MIKIISIEERNPYADPDKCNDGGGYYQPSIIFEYDGQIGKIEDCNCGDFGKRYFVEFGDKYYHYDGISYNPIEETNFTEDDNDFIEEFNKTFRGYRIYPKTRR